MVRHLLVAVIAVGLGSVVSGCLASPNGANGTLEIVVQGVTVGFDAARIEVTHGEKGWQHIETVPRMSFIGGTTVRIEHVRVGRYSVRVELRSSNQQVLCGSAADVAIRENEVTSLLPGQYSLGSCAADGDSDGDTTPDGDTAPDGDSGDPDPVDGDPDEADQADQSDQTDQSDTESPDGDLIEDGDIPSDGDTGIDGDTAPDGDTDEIDPDESVAADTPDDEQPDGDLIEAEYDPDPEADQDEALGLVWVRIPAGSAGIGCSPGDQQCAQDELPAHTVRFAAFELLATEVTQAQYLAVTGAAPSHFGACGGQCPVEQVSWHEAASFCAAVGGRLPTEAEWEYAARGGTTTRYYCGDDPVCLPDIAWLDVNNESTTHPAGTRLPNDYGLYDMLGNVWEWTQECWHDDYSGAPETGQLWTGGDCTGRVARGGSWYYNAPSLRVSNKLKVSPDQLNNNHGFRCARDLGLSDGFRRIYAGTFVMGSPDGINCPPDRPGCTIAEYPAEPGREEDETQHQVTLTYDFEMMQHEVTQAEFTAFAGNNPSWFGPNGDGVDCGTDCPVERVNWYEALAHANWLSSQKGFAPCYVLSGCAGTVGGGCPASVEDCSSGTYTCAVTLNGATKPQDCAGYRLPTEAEWEFAARAGTTTAYSNGQDSDSSRLACETPFHLTNIAWYCGNENNTTHPVVDRTPNAWNLYDTSGNVWEWTWDKYCNDYHEYSIDPDVSRCQDTSRLNRGGAYRSNARSCRSAFREYDGPSYRFQHVGFRLVRTLDFMPACTPDYCHGNGTCSDTTGVAVCGCDTGFAGRTCDRCAEGYGGYPGCAPLPCPDGAFLDSATGLQWQLVPTTEAEQQNWAGAVAYCQNLYLCGTGWRLPTISELRSLARGCPATQAGGVCGVNDGCLLLSCHLGGDCSGCAELGGPGSNGCYWPAELNGSCERFYWSSSFLPDYVGNAWYYFYYNGLLAQVTTNNSGGYARCVR